MFGKREKMKKFAVYKKGTDELITFGTTQTCAQELGISEGTFSWHRSHYKNGTGKNKYDIKLISDLSEEDTGAEQGNMDSESLGAATACIEVEETAKKEQPEYIDEKEMLTSPKVNAAEIKAGATLKLEGGERAKVMAIWHDTAFVEISYATTINLEREPYEVEK